MYAAQYAVAVMLANLCTTIDLVHNCLDVMPHIKTKGFGAQESIKILPSALLTMHYRIQYNNH